MLDHNSKIRFYHVPKSGGTTIFNMTQNWKNFKRAHPRKNHVAISYYPPGIGEIGLAVIRHPYSRFISAFYHMVDSCNSNFYYRNAKQSDCETLKSMGVSDFGNLYNNDPNIFLEALDNKQNQLHYITKEIFNNFDIFKPQFYWLSDIFSLKIHPGIKIILNQESLESEFNTIAQQIGQVPTWSQRINSRLSQNEIPLSDHSKNILNKIYKQDFQHFTFKTLSMDSFGNNSFGNNSFGTNNIHSYNSMFY